MKLYLLRNIIFILLILVINIKCSSSTNSLYFNTFINNTIPITKTDRNLLSVPNFLYLHAKSYILIDVNSGKILIEKNSEKKFPPASLTKIMTLYIISNAIKNGQILLKDKIHISTKSWKIGGSKMFLKIGQKVSIQDILKGIIVDSGNDACIAISEYICGNEFEFSKLMNNQAKILKMENSNFTNSTGLPNKNLYTTAKDMAILGRSIIKDFPEYYNWYKQKQFIFNKICQLNRNKLLWYDNQVDGIKTGYTKQAGYCLVSSAINKENMRLLAVVMGEPSDYFRINDSRIMLNYGFRFFETHKLYRKLQTIKNIKVYKGIVSYLPIGLLYHDQFITIPRNHYKNISISIIAPNNLQAPIIKGEKVGQLIIKFYNSVLINQDLYALKTIENGSVLKKVKDSIQLLYINSILNRIK